MIDRELIDQAKSELAHWPDWETRGQQPVAREVAPEVFAAAILACAPPEKAARPTHRIGAITQVRGLSPPVKPDPIAELTSGERDYGVGHCEFCKEAFTKRCANAGNCGRQACRSKQRSHHSTGYKAKVRIADKTACPHDMGFVSKGTRLNTDGSRSEACVRCGLTRKRAPVRGKDQDGVMGEAA